MNIHKIIVRGERIITDNSPIILTALGVVGTVGTAYLASKASFRAAMVIEDAQAMERVHATGHALTAREKFEKTWKLYIPAVISAVSTCSCIVMANRIEVRRAAAVAAGLQVTQAAFNEYKDKVVEQIGANKEKKVTEQIAAEKARRIKPDDVILYEGDVLMVDGYSGRPFTSSIEKVRAIERKLQHKIAEDDAITLTDWFDEIGLRATSHSSEFGFNTGTPIELEYTAVVTESEQPAIVWNFGMDPILRPWTAASFRGA